MKITREQLEVFKEYHGDFEMLVRMNWEKANTLSANKEWGKIDDWIQDIKLIDRNLVSVEYRNRILSEIDSSVDNADIDFLYEIARGF